MGFRHERLSLFSAPRSSREPVMPVADARSAPRRLPAGSLWLACAVAATVWLGAGASARADDVRGTIGFKPEKLGKPPVRNRGFVERIENPLRPIRDFEPWPYLVVVLEGGPVDDEAKQAPGGTVTYELRGESFHVPLLPVIAGTRIKLDNKGLRATTLVTPEEPELVDSVALNPLGSHEFKVATPHQVILIRGAESSHLRGRVVGFPDRYFAPVDDRGRFELKGVPEGTWKLRVWFRDGWIDGVEQTVEVQKKKRVEVELTLTPDQVRPAAK